MKVYLTNRQRCRRGMIGGRIRKQRVAVELSVAGLAARLGMTESTLRRIENTELVPDIAVLIAVSDFFEISIDDLCMYDAFDPRQREGLNPDACCF